MSISWGGKAAHRWVLVALLGVGLALRLWGAWAYRGDPSTDRGRAALMTQHIAEGQAFPVFFYGEAYLGSAESFAGAFFCRLFGCHGFTANLGTVLFGFLLLPLLYAWAREIRGDAAGWAAVLFCLLGPFGFFYFSVSPRGGYAAAVTCATAVLWMGGRLAAQERVGRARVGGYAGLGLAAGLGWWSNQLVTPALLTAALVLTAALRGRVGRGRVAVAAGCFLAASAPWWLWNLQHDWATFRFLGSLEGGSWPSGLKLFFVDRLLDLLDVPVAWTGWTVAVLAALVGLLAAAGAAGRKEASRTFPAARWHLASVSLFVVVSAFLFASSHFARTPSSRYLLPLVPALALLTGVGLAWCAERRTRRIIGGLFFAALLAGQLRGFVAEFRPAGPDARWRAASAMAAFCRAQGIESVYGYIWEHWLNFASGDHLQLCDLEAEPYAPYAQRAELARRVALLNAFADFRTFLNGTQTACHDAAFPPYTLQHNFTPPAPWTRLPRDAVRSVAANGAPAPALMDDDVSTGQELGDEATLTATFADAPRLAGVRLRCPEGQYPESVRIEGLTEDGAAWQELLPDTGATGYFWSGPRWYWSGTFYRLEYALSPPVALKAVRIHVRGRAVAVAEWQLLESGGEPAASRETALAELVRLLDARDIRQLYADRWESAQVHRATEGRVRTVLPAVMQRTVQSLRQPVESEFAPLASLPADSALLVLAREAALLRKTLAGRGLVLRETEVGPWRLFDFADQTWKARNATHPGLQWEGWGLARISDERYTRLRGDGLYREALAGLAQTPPDPQAADLLREALALYPGHGPARLLAETLAPRHPAVAECLAGLPEPIEPDRRLSVKYAGAELVGVTVGPARVKRGERWSMQWFWQSAPETRPEEYAVFVHLRGPGARFQDDHGLLEGVPTKSLAVQPVPETFRVTREVAIPADVPPGLYTVSMGLLHRSTGRRLRPQTDLPTRRRATELPFTLVVE